MKNLFGEDYSVIPVKKKVADKEKTNWENAFQKWSNKMAFDETNYDTYGHCGFGVICDYCRDNTYGRPCVRALNEYCRENYKTIDYTVRDFKKIWRGELMPVGRDSAKQMDF